MLANTIEKIDNVFIDNQLDMAGVALKSNDKSQALSHYKSAYGEALWLCEHHIDNANEFDAISAKQSYDYLSTIAQSLLKYIDSTEQAEEIKSQLLGVSMRVNSEFGVDISSEVLSDVTCSTTSLMPLKLNFFKSVFA